MARGAAPDLQRQLLSGPKTARELLPALEVSQATLSRLTRAAGDRVLRIGRARATQYALARTVPGAGEHWPVYRIDARGRPHRAALLHAIFPEGWWYQTERKEPVLLPGSFETGLFGDWPWFLDDLRPQGFIGRAFARRHGPPLGLPEDPRLWSAGGVLRALLIHGHDLPGDFVLGEAALERAQRATLSPPDPIPRKGRVAIYADLARAALAGDLPGSSAAGEQPKFTARVEGDDGTARQTIVKFSPPLSTANGRRWGDLLVCEHLAAVVLGEHGIESSRTEWLVADGRAFLQVERFDRTEHGRVGAVSLFSLDAVLYGRLDRWDAAASRLAADGWLDARAARTLSELWWFGRLIGNTDLHFGNVSLLLAARRPLSLAPAYDMLPMAYQPLVTGEVVEREVPLALPPPEQLAVWSHAAAAATAFWTLVGNDRRLASDLRAIGRQRARAIRAAVEQMS